jgi:hypothetical protein
MLGACGVILVGATGCNSQQQQASKPTGEQITAFKGDPSMMPRDIQKKLAPQPDAMQKQIAAQQASGTQNAPAAK